MRQRVLQPVRQVVCTLQLCRNILKGTCLPRAVNRAGQRVLDLFGPYDFFQLDAAQQPDVVGVLVLGARQLEDVAERRPIAWGLGEALAFGSLLLEGVPIRMSGQDTRRGTFSQRHAVLFDAETEQPYVPLQRLDTMLL